MFSATRPRVTTQLIGSVLVVLLAVGCTWPGSDEEDELTVETVPPLSADEQRAAAAGAVDSPIPVLVDGGVVETVEAGNGQACTELDQRSATAIEGTEFFDRLSDLGRAHPTDGAELRAEITFAADLLGRCADGDPVSAEQLTRLSEIVETWEGMTG